MDRLGRRNVLTLSGRAVEASGDCDLLLLDKTGTITLGNREAVEFTPMPGSNADVTLRVPYYFVPRARSDVKSVLGTLKGKDPSASVTVTNKKGMIPGDADFYAWGLADDQESVSASADVRAIGTQSFSFPSATDADRRLLVFAVNTFNRWSTASTNEFDIYVDGTLAASKAFPTGVGTSIGRIDIFNASTNVTHWDEIDASP